MFTNLIGGGGPPQSDKTNNNGDMRYYSRFLGGGKITLVVIITLVYLHNWHYEIIKAWLNGITIMFFVIASGIVALFTWFSYEKMLILRAKRYEAEKTAQTMVITSNDGGVYLRETSHKASVKALHLQKSYNGHYMPTQNEVDQWLAYISRKQNKQLIKQPELFEPVETIEPALMPSLTEVLKDTDRVLIKGASNAGKTNLLMHVANHRLSYSDVYVIDPHSSPNKWGDCFVVGGGANYSEIENYLSYFVGDMDSRFSKQYSGEVGESQFPPLTIIIDEFLSLAMNIKTAKDAIKRLLTESRKINYSMFVGVHSERVEALGLKGVGDLRDSFTFVRLENNNGLRSATIDYGKGEIETIIPTAFGGFTQVREIKPLLNTAATAATAVEPVEITSQDKRIKELRDMGLSYNKIALEVYESQGGQQTRLIKQSLAKFNGVNDG